MKGAEMKAYPTPEEKAAALVTTGCLQAGGPWHVRLHDPQGETVLLAAEPNPSLAEDQASAIRRFLACVIREARQSGPAGNGA